jgi:hypothetical protein
VSQAARVASRRDEGIGGTDKSHALTQAAAWAVPSVETQDPRLLAVGQMISALRALPSSTHAWQEHVTKLVKRNSKHRSPGVNTCRGGCWIYSVTGTGTALSRASQDSPPGRPVRRSHLITLSAEIVFTRVKISLLLLIGDVLILPVPTAVSLAGSPATPSLKSRQGTITSSLRRLCHSARFRARRGRLLP